MADNLERLKVVCWVVLLVSYSAAQLVVCLAVPKVEWKVYSLECLKVVQSVVRKAA